MTYKEVAKMMKTANNRADGTDLSEQQARFLSQNYKKGFKNMSLQDKQKLQNLMKRMGVTKPIKEFKVQ